MKYGAGLQRAKLSVRLYHVGVQTTEVSEDVSGESNEGTQVAFDTVATVLADNVASGILRETAEEPMSAHELADALDTSPPTVYRRLDDLREHDLVTTSTRPDPDGHHTDIHRAAVSDIQVSLDDDGFTVELDRRDTPADRFTRIIEDM